MTGFVTGSWNGYHLKMLAMITMFIDHVGATLVWKCYELSGYSLTWIRDGYDTMRLIGRLAFPIFCFLLVEGFVHTRSVSKYALRLGLFALLSEVPFDMAISERFFTKNSCNVFFTLLIGLLLIWGISYLETFYEFWLEKNLDRFIGTLVTVAIGVLLVIPACYVAEVVLGTDYGAGGVMAILLMYLFRKNRMLAYILGVMALGIMVHSNEYMALLVLLPLYLYDGTRGKNVKYEFYAFYPIHLAILGGICMML